MKRTTKANLGKLLMDGVRIASDFLETPERTPEDDAPAPSPSPHQASDLETRAFELRGEGTPLPTKLNLETNEREIGWEVADPQIKMEQQFIAAATTFMFAIGVTPASSPTAVMDAARTASLWWHGLTEDDVPKS